MSATEKPVPENHQRSKDRFRSAHYPAKRALMSFLPLGWLALWMVMGLVSVGAGETKDELIVRLTVNVSMKYHHEVTEENYQERQDDQLLFTYQGESKYDLIADPHCYSPTNHATQSVSGGGSYHEAKPGVNPVNSEWSYALFQPDTSLFFPLSAAKPDPIRARCLVYGQFLTYSLVVPGQPQGNGPVKNVCGDAISTFILNTAGFSDQFDLPKDKTQYSVSWGKQGTSANLPANIGGAGTWEATALIKIEVIRNPAQWEAVIVTDLKDPSLPRYEDWLPIGGDNESTPGTNWVLRIELRAKGETNVTALAGAKFSLRLNDTTREPGVCLNYPAKEKALDTPDLKFHESPDLIISEEGQSAQTVRDDLHEIIVVVDCYDYGAYATLTADAQVQGADNVKAFDEAHPEQEFLRIPKDDNENHVADAWEKAIGVYSWNLPPEWDKDASPGGQNSDGDGLTFYEEYRGFRCKGVYERLTPQTKDFFIYDPDGLVLATFIAQPEVPNVLKASGVLPHLIWNREWSGVGSAGSHGREINFNTSGFAHLTTQHGTDIHIAGFVPCAKDSKTGKSVNTSGAPATTYPDYSFHGTGGPGDYIFCQIRPWRIESDIWREVRYHTQGLPLFSGIADPNLSAKDRQALNQLLDQATDEFIANHPGDYARALQLRLSQIVSHELCHTLNAPDHEPYDGGYKLCIMRYLPLEDYAPDPSDRFCLARRQPWPSKLCVSGDACRSKIQVSDWPGTAGSTRASRRSQSSGEPPDNPVRSISSASVNDDVPFELSAAAAWDPIIEGDPLPVTVRLEAPRVEQARIGWWTGQTNLPDGTLTVPSVAADWYQGLSLELTRLTTQGEHEVVLTSGTWETYLRPPAIDFTSLGMRLTVLAREWVLDGTNVQLTAGMYELRGSWNGYGWPETNRPAGFSGLSFPTVSLTVVPARNTNEQALHFGRLAANADALGQWNLARSLGLQAIQLNSTGTNLEMRETRLLTAQAALRQEDYSGAFQLLKAAPGLDPRDELERQMKETQAALAPRLQLKKAPSSLSPLLIIQGLPNQVITSDQSGDAVHWIPVSTNLTDSAGQVLLPQPAAPGTPRLLRARWTP